jgi:tetratricopeptide (TPR) repeat protein
LGEALTWLGKFAEALAPLEESKAIYDDLGLRDRVAFSMAMLAYAMIHLGEYEPAFHKAQVAFTDFQELGSRRGMGYALLVMGWAYLGAGQTAEARQLLHKSLTIYQEIGQRDELAQALALLGYAAYRLDDPSQAQQHLIEGLRTATQIRAFMPMMLALPALALLLIDQDRHEQTIELYALASRYPFVANSQWFEDMAGQEVAAVNLLTEVVATAQERGKAGELEEVVAELLGDLVEW